MTSSKTCIAISAAAALLSACVSIPEFDDTVETPAEFQSEIAGLDGYPDTTQTPVRPTNMRSDASWDAAARALLARSNAFDGVDEGSIVATDAELIAARQQLLTLVNAYKLDDPQP